MNLRVEENQKSTAGKRGGSPFSSWPITARVGVTVAVLVAIAGTVAAITTQRIERNFIFKQFEKETQTIGTVVADSVANLLMTQDTEGLRAVGDDLLAQNDGIFRVSFNVAASGSTIMRERPASQTPIHGSHQTVVHVERSGFDFGSVTIDFSHDPVEEAVSQHAFLIALLFAVGMLLAGLLVLTSLHRLVVHPVAMIFQRIRSFKPGERVPPLTLSGPPELVRLNHAVDELSEGYRTWMELEQKLQHSQKMEAVGRLAGGIAHNYNNALMVILGYVELLEQRFRDDPQVLQEIKAVQQAGDHAASLTKQLLALGRREGSNRLSVDISRQIIHMQAFLRPLVGEDVDLEVHCSPCGPIQIDPSLLESILINLVINAEEAIDHSGNIDIRCEPIPPGQEPDWLHEKSDLGWVHIKVRDNGTGMDEATRRQIFEPFFTTKDIGKGTGLGLSTVYTIVRQNGGMIDVDSAPGRGTQFSILFPVCDTPPESSMTEPTTQEIVGKGKLLVVEDDQSVLELTRRVLETNGYDITTATDGNRAIELLNDDNFDIDLLLTDVSLPGTDGTRLAADYRLKFPELPVIYMTGYADPALEKMILGQDRCVLLGKPFRPGHLLKTVSSLLTNNH